MCVIVLIGGCMVVVVVLQLVGVCSSVVEHEIADLRVAGSIPVAPLGLLVRFVS